jgi:septum site-determining protein MinC
MRNPTRAVREPACEVRFGQLSLGQVRLRTLVPEELSEELARKTAAAPQLFERAAVCVDLSALAEVPTAAELGAVLEALRGAGLFPVGLSYGTDEVDALARALSLPVIAKFRGAYESAAATTNENTAATDTAASAATAPANVTSAVAAQVHEQPIRSGQQVYARGRDLAVTALIGAGAEVIADGSIHVYGALRGRALAGAQGDTSARIFCQDFRAELVSIAGHWRVFETMPKEFDGKPVQIRLDGEKLILTRLG